MCAVNSGTLKGAVSTSVGGGTMGSDVGGMGPGGGGGGVFRVCFFVIGWGAGGECT